MERRKKHTVLVKALYKYPVPTKEELTSILELLKNHSAYKVAFGLLFVTGMRPSEVASLRWNNFIIDRGDYAGVIHGVYKPKNRMHKSGNTSEMRKKLKKPIFSKWLNEQLIKYRAKGFVFEDNKVFGFTQPDSIQKCFQVWRKKNAHELPFLLDKIIEPLGGQENGTKYRLSPYSLRRFCMTFHYYTTFHQDIVTTSKFFGHSNPKTTYEHYIHPKEAIGLTQEMIHRNIKLDEFLGFDRYKHTPLDYFYDNIGKEVNKAFVTGQRSLLNYVSP